MEKTNNDGCEGCKYLTKDEKCNWKVINDNGKKEQECLEEGDCDRYVRQKKIIKIKVDKKMQEEMNEIRKECGQEPNPIKPDYELEALFG